MMEASNRWQLRVAALFLVLASVVGQGRAQDAVELVNPAGWAVPGLKAIAGMHLVPRVERKKTDSVDYSVLTYQTDPARVESRAERVPILIPSRDKPGSYVFLDYQIAASTVWRYETAAGCFAYRVRGPRYVVDPVSGEGGFAAEFILVFEDRVGKGKFEVLREGLSPEFVPEVPGWARERKGNSKDKL